MVLREGFRNTSLRYNKIKKTLQRCKNKKYPKKPRSIEDIRDTFLDPDVIKQYGYNLEGDMQFYAGTVIENDYGFTIFISKFTMDFIENNIAPGSRHYLMDGTFDSLPGNFYQLLIITIEYRNDVSSLIIYKFCLFVG